MNYASLSEKDRHDLVLSRLRELEAHHFSCTIEESEEPGGSEARTKAIADLERRIAGYHHSLGFTAKMAGDSPERSDDEVA